MPVTSSGSSRPSQGVGMYSTELLKNPKAPLAMPEPAATAQPAAAESITRPPSSPNSALARQGALLAYYRRHNGGETSPSTPAQPITIAVTGANGSIAGHVINQIGSEVLLGPHQPVKLRLLGRDPDKLEGVAMEVKDCAYKGVVELTTHTDPYEAFKDADIVFGIGASPRTKGMTRGDLLERNVGTFIEQGTAFGQVAAPGAQFMVVGNPTSGLAHVVSECAGPRMGAENVTAMHMLDQLRAEAAIAQQSGEPVASIKDVMVFGNHSDTTYPYYGMAIVNGKPAQDYLGPLTGNWNTQELLPTVRTRGSAVLNKRGASSALSAATATIEQMRRFLTGNNGEMFTMGVRSHGEYGIKEGVWSSFPVRIVNGDFHIVQGYARDNFSQNMLEETNEDLMQEHAQASDFLKQQQASGSQ
jgi:malate dehydrogenase